MSTSSRNVPAQAMDQTGYCNHCQRKVTFHIEPVNHLKQLLFSIFTLGLWLPIWLLVALVKTRICDVCGKALPEE